MSSQKAFEVSTIPGVAGKTTRKRRAAPSKVAEVPARASVYRGLSVDEARAAYYADARAMSRMGFVPTTEDWSTVLEHVLTVRYVFEPDRQPAVIAALDQMEAEPDRATEPPPAPTKRFSRLVDLWHALPLELRISLGGIAGLLVGLARCLMVGLLSGDSPDTLSIVGFGAIGLVLGASLGLVPPDPA